MLLPRIPVHPCGFCRDKSPPGHLRGAGEFHKGGGRFKTRSWLEAVLTIVIEAQNSNLETGRSNHWLEACATVAPTTRDSIASFRGQVLLFGLVFKEKMHPDLVGNDDGHKGQGHRQHNL